MIASEEMLKARKTLAHHLEEFGVVFEGRQPQYGFGEVLNACHILVNELPVGRPRQPFRLCQCQHVRQRLASRATPAHHSLQLQPCSVPSLFVSAAANSSPTAYSTNCGLSKTVLLISSLALRLYQSKTHIRSLSQNTRLRRVSQRHGQGTHRARLQSASDKCPALRSAIKSTSNATFIDTECS